MQPLPDDEDFPLTVRVEWRTPDGDWLRAWKPCRYAFRPAVRSWPPLIPMAGTRRTWTGRKSEPLASSNKGSILQPIPPYFAWESTPRFIAS